MKKKPFSEPDRYTRRYIANKWIKMAIEKETLAWNRGECVKNITYKWNMHIWFVVVVISLFVCGYLFFAFPCSVCISSVGCIIVVQKDCSCYLFSSKTLCIDRWRLPRSPFTRRTHCMCLFMLVQMRARLYFLPLCCWFCRGFFPFSRAYRFVVDRKDDDGNGDGGYAAAQVSCKSFFLNRYYLKENMSN